MRVNLAYYRYCGHDQLVKPIQAMVRLSERIGQAKDTQELMGIEGYLNQSYYPAWADIDARLDFLPRVRRPPNNPINCLISFLNQLVYTAVRHEAFKTHLEETFSFLHAPSMGRSSLCLDLSEPFKPVLSHALILRLVRKQMVDDSWFDQKEGICLLTEIGRQRVAEQFATRLEESYQGRTFREWIYREALHIERHLMGIAEYVSFKRDA